MSINNTNRTILANYILGQGSSATQGKNYVKNSFAMNGTANVSVSGSATVAKNTTTPLTGISDFLITLANNTADYVEWSLDTLDNSLKNQNCQFTFDYTVGSIGSAVQAQVVTNGTIADTYLLSSLATPGQVLLNSPCGTIAGATTVRISNATGNSGTSSINVANVNYGKATNLSDASIVTPWTSYTPTFTALGTVTSIEFQWRRVGSDLEVRGKYVGGTPTGSEGRVSFPTGLTSAGTSVIPTIQVAGVNGYSQTVATSGYILVEPSVTYFTFGQQSASFGALTKLTGTNVVGSGNTMSLMARTPIAGWATGSAVSADQTDYDWTAYTPTFTGLGTVTAIECQHARISSDLKLRCKFVAGTPTGVEARLSLPSGLTSASTSKIPSVQLAGKMNSANSNTTYFSGQTVLIEPSVTYVTFGVESSTTNGATKALGTTMSGAGATFTFFASIPIQGWTANQRAPTLIGSVTSNTQGTLRIETAKLFCNATSAITSQSSTWVSTLGNIASGVCSGTIASGVFSSEPTCSYSNSDLVSATAGTIYNVNPSSSTAFVVTGVCAGSACGNFNIDIICIGSR